MTVLQPFLDILASLYAAYQKVAAASGAAQKMLAGLNFVQFTVYLPQAIANAPGAVDAFENLSDADRKQVEDYLAGKLQGLDADVVKKVVAGLDIVIRGGGIVSDVLVLFKSVAAAPAATVAAQAAPVEAKVDQAAQAVQAATAEVK